MFDCNSIFSFCGDVFCANLFSSTNVWFSCVPCFSIISVNLNAKYVFINRNKLEFTIHRNLSLTPLNGQFYFVSNFLHKNFLNAHEN
jgi:hypothetical protein